MTLFVARHGQTDWNLAPTRCQGWADVPLNDRGREQAHELGRSLRGRGLELIVSSHLARARETAELVRDELAAGPATAPIELRLDERLAETRRGAWEARLFEEIIREEPAAWAAYREHPETFRFPGGESLAEQQRRVLEAVRDAALAGRVALLVTHGGSIRLLRAFLTGEGVAAFHRLKAPNGAILALDEPDLPERVDAFLAGSPTRR